MNTTKSRSSLAVILIASGLMLSNVTFAQEHKSSCCGSGMEKEVTAMNDVSGDSTKKMDMNHQMHKDRKMKMDCMSKPDSSKTMNGMKHDMKNMDHKMSSLVHEGVIDLQSIDQNKDGRVYQDQMDWNVISDKPGKCPLCKMTLKEVTLKQAKDNLVQNDFKVK